MTNDDNVLGELQTIGLETNAENVRPLKKLVGFVSFKPYFPRMDRALSGKSRMRLRQRARSPASTMAEMLCTRSAFFGLSFFVFSSWKAWTFFRRLLTPAGEAKTVALAGAASFSGLVETFRRRRPLASRLFVTKGSFGLAWISRYTPGRSCAAGSPISSIARRSACACARRFGTSLGRFA